MTGNGKDDLIVCGFGHNVGALTWHENLGNNEFKTHVLSNDPGAIKVEITDANKDGLPDILALMAQGMERLDLYVNNGEGTFTVETLLSFPPVYGSLYFELADFNDDGNFDILYANGDNADYSIAPKKFHGIRIFENDGNNGFEEILFHPMYGAIKSMANDFDQDGDLDIMAISFFPEYEIANNESIVFLENQGENHFAPFTLPNNHAGHWMVMDIGDVDQDGDEDVLLGSLLFGMNVPNSLAAQWKSESKNIMVLENQLK